MCLTCMAFFNTLNSLTIVGHNDILEHTLILLLRFNVAQPHQSSSHTKFLDHYHFTFQLAGLYGNWVPIINFHSCQIWLLNLSKRGKKKKKEEKRKHTHTHTHNLPELLINFLAMG